MCELSLPEILEQYFIYEKLTGKRLGLSPLEDAKITLNVLLERYPDSSYFYASSVLLDEINEYNKNPTNEMIKLRDWYIGILNSIES